MNISSGQVEWCYPDGLVSNGELQCPPIKYACASSTINMLSPRTDPIPPPRKMFMIKS